MVIDRDYRVTAEAVGFTINKKSGDDLRKFPIEKARLRSIWYFMGLLIASTVGYGWSVETKTVRHTRYSTSRIIMTWLTRIQHMAVPLVLQFLSGIGVTGTFNVGIHGHVQQKTGRAALLTRPRSCAHWSSTFTLTTPQQRVLRST